MSDSANRGTAYEVTSSGAIERLSPVMEALYLIGDGAGAIAASSRPQVKRGRHWRER